MCRGCESAAEPCVSGSAMLGWGLGVGWAWQKMPKMVPSLVCRAVSCVVVGSPRVCGPSGLVLRPCL